MPHQTYVSFKLSLYSAVNVKIVFSVLANRMTVFMIGNGYLQNLGITDFAGYQRHPAVLIQLIHEARLRNGNLTLVWMDLANALGSIPDDPISTELKYDHVPDRITQ